MSTPAIPGAAASGRITTVDDLRDHLQWAIELEHSTLPPYLCALYSLDPDRNRDAVEVVSSVFLEEMLHLTLAANLLNAVGGRPRLDPEHLLRGYPGYLPHGDRSFEVSLVPFGAEALELFLNIERPAAPEAPPEGDDYETIGQFYAAIEQGIRALCAELGAAEVFTGDPARQVPSGTFHSDAGQIIAVVGLDTALEALGEIVEQGEGTARHDVWDGEHGMFHPEQDEVAHYYRFEELKLGRRYRRGDTPASGPTGEALVVDWAAVSPMRRNPRLADHAPGSRIRTAQERFNRSYALLLSSLEHVFDGNPHLLWGAIGPMHDLREMAMALMQMPTGDGDTTAGPTFEYVAPNDDQGPTHESPHIVIQHNGPYTVHGPVALVRKRKLVSEDGHALNWEKTETLATEQTFQLCRCGQSASKPFCDGSHQRVGFDGSETADTRPYAEREQRFEAEGLSVRYGRGLCMHAAFCVGRTRRVSEMVADAHDSDVRAGIMGRIDRCPSGAYAYAIEPGDDAVEPDLPQEIAVIEEESGLASGLWVTGGIPIQRSDAQPMETRNRVMLCRCGQSANKPLCDGTHRRIGFHE